MARALKRRNCASETPRTAAMSATVHGRCKSAWIARINVPILEPARSVRRIFLASVELRCRDIV
jgi:hypothetical protein